MIGFWYFKFSGARTLLNGAQVINLTPPLPNEPKRTTAAYASQSPTCFSRECMFVVLRRLKVLGIGVLFGAAFSLYVAALQMPSNWDLVERAWAWVFVMGGPIVGTWWGMATFHLGIGLGWLGLLLAPSHALWPNSATAAFTLVGLGLWFVAGFLTIVVAMWGA